MNILIATSSYPLRSDTAWAPFLKEIAAAIADPGHRLTVLVFSPENRRTEYVEPENPFVRVVAYPYPWPGRAQLHDSVGLIPSLRKSFPARLQIPFYLFASAVEILRAVRRYEIDIVHAQWYFPMGFLAALLKPLFKKPLAVSGLGADLHLPNHPWIRSLLRFTAQRADLNIVCSRYLLDRARGYGLDTSAFQIVPNAADHGKFHPAGKTAENKIIIGCVKRLIPEKNLEDLIEAVSLLDGTDKEKIEVRILGEGPSKDHLREAVRRRRLEDVVRMPGKFPHADVPAFLRQLDIYVDTSTQEGVATSNIEALASGCLVIAPDGFGNRDLIEHEKTGLLYRPRDTNEIRGWLQAMIRDEARRRRIARAGREAAMARCDTRFVAAQLKNFYAKLTCTGTNFRG